MEQFNIMCDKICSDELRSTDLETNGRLLTGWKFENAMSTVKLSNNGDKIASFQAFAK